MGYGGLGLGGRIKLLVVAKHTYLRVPLSPSFPSEELCYEPGNSEGELDSKRPQTRELS